MNGNCQCNKMKLNLFDRRNSQLNTSLLFEKMGGRLNVDFKNRLKPDLFLKSYIYSERGDFAASFYWVDAKISADFFSFLCFKFLLKQNTINQQRIYHCYL